ncbi:MAG: DUF805 domain-containing protein [Bacteroidales bacterium]|nr:DUF805 domain-containing protein [Bacteroidales bacterium]MCM1148200.1 DUF805 domain-containing protein [Bacteroidales bacterium]MCM1207073.1 DUF805 domain-containing protein [Bacillota bacterium]MCM1510817.1 DUF805 domain-containing protein [Clostridium sp.]
METNTIPTLEFTEAIKQAANRIAQFSGRARRSEYWWTRLLVWLLSIVCTPIAGFVFDVLTIPLTFRRLHDTGRSGWWWGAGAIMKTGIAISVIYDFLALTVSTANPGFEGYGPGAAYAVIMKYILWVLLIMVYELVMLFFLCQDSDPYENEYGESPKYVADDTDGGSDV